MDKLLSLASASSGSMLNMSNPAGGPSASSPMRELVPESLRPFVLLSYPVRPASASVADTCAHPPRRDWAAAYHSPFTTGHQSSWGAFANLGGASLSVHDSPASVPSHNSSYHLSGNGDGNGNGNGVQGGSAADMRTLYGAGPADMAFVLFAALALTVMRHLMMKYVFGAFARGYLERRDRRLVAERQALIRGKRIPKVGNNTRDGEQGIPPKPMGRRKREYAVTRFSEQGWAAAYPMCTWTFGVVCPSFIPPFFACALSNARSGRARWECQRAAAC